MDPSTPVNHSPIGGGGGGGGGGVGGSAALNPVLPKRASSRLGSAFQPQSPHDPPPTPAPQHTPHTPNAGNPGTPNSQASPNPTYRPEASPADDGGTTTADASVLHGKTGARHMLGPVGAAAAAAFAAAGVTGAAGGSAAAAAAAAPTEYFEMSDYPELKGRYNLLSSVGKGTFSLVYKAEGIPPYATSPPFWAIKRIHRLSGPRRIENEIDFLNQLRGRNSIVALDRVIHEDGYTSLVLPYFEHRHFKEYFMTMTLEDVQQYMAGLFTSLAYLHKMGVIHRDVKPSNFLQSPDKNKFLLIDFGLAEWEKEVLQAAQEGENAPPAAPAPAIASSASSSAAASATSRRGTSSASVPPPKRKSSESTTASATAAIAAGVEIDSYANKRVKHSANAAAAAPSTPQPTQSTRTDPRLAAAAAAKAAADSTDAGGRHSSLAHASPLPTDHNNGMAPPRPKPDRRSRDAREAVATAVSKSLQRELGESKRFTANSAVDKSHKPLKRTAAPPAPPSVPATHRTASGSAAAAAAVVAASRMAVNTSSRGMEIFKHAQAAAERAAAASASASAPKRPSLRRYEAPRAGTRGFRAPEVLAKYRAQTAAIDVWSAGVILLSILVRRYPLFNSPDDESAMLEIEEMLGPIPPNVVPNRLFHVDAGFGDGGVERVRHRVSNIQRWVWANRLAPIYTGEGMAARNADWPIEAYQLVEACLRFSPADRVTAQHALAHPFFDLGTAEAGSLRTAAAAFDDTAMAAVRNPIVAVYDRVETSPDASLAVRHGVDSAAAAIAARAAVSAYDAANAASAAAVAPAGSAPVPVGPAPLPVAVNDSLCDRVSNAAPTDVEIPRPAAMRRRRENLSAAVAAARLAAPSPLAAASAAAAATTTASALQELLRQYQAEASAVDAAAAASADAAVAADTYVDATASADSITVSDATIAGVKEIWVEPEARKAKRLLDQQTAAQLQQQSSTAALLKHPQLQAQSQSKSQAMALSRAHITAPPPAVVAAPPAKPATGSAAAAASKPIAGATSKAAAATAAAAAAAAAPVATVAHPVIDLPTKPKSKSKPKPPAPAVAAAPVIVTYAARATRGSSAAAAAAPPAAKRTRSVRS